jgi:hypothetical protein
MTLDMTVKFADGSDTIIEGYGVPFGLDLDGQQFTPETDRCHEWFPKGGRPILYDHGFNKTIKMTPVGWEISTEQREEGDWVRAELDKASKYYNRVKQLVDAGKVGWSSAAPDHKVKIARDGHIDLWPTIEYSLTTGPAKPNLVAFAMKAAQVVDLFEDLADSPLRGISEWGTAMVKHVDIVKQAAADVAAAIEQTPESDTEPVSLADHSEQVLAGMKAWVERMEERSDFRMKVGRELSKANIDALRAAYATIGALLEKADKPSEDEQRKVEASKAFAEYLRVEAEILGASPD